MKKLLSTLTLLLFALSMYSQCYADRHNTSPKDHWVSCNKRTSPNPELESSHWIWYDLRQVYALGTTNFWNYNMAGQTDMGAKSIQIDVSLDEQTWNTVGVFDVPQAPGSTFYEGVDGPDFDGVEAQYVLITVLETWGNEECAGFGEFRMNIHKPIFTDLVVEQISCNGENNGSLCIEPTGGVGAFEISWSTGETGNCIDNLGPGTYISFVTDELNNTKTDTAVIEEPAALSLDLLSQTNVDCQSTTGSIEVSASGGTGMLSYYWPESGATDAFADNLEPGEHTVIVTDENECTVELSVEIEADNDSPIAVASAEDLNCVIDEIVIDATGSSTGDGFSYQWSTDDGNIVSGESTLSPTINAAGNYTLFITNTINNCEAQTSIVIEEIPDVEISLVNSTNNSCFESADGTAEVSASFGVGVYSYLWSNGETGAMQNNLEAGEYIVVVEDELSCSAEIVINITEPEPLQITLDNISHIDCANPIGQVAITGEGGTGSLFYEWSEGSSGDQLETEEGGEFIVVLTDENDCVIEESFTIIQDIEEPEIQINAEKFHCNLTELTIDGAGSSTGETFEYSWTTMDGNLVSGADELNPTIDEAGTYELTILNTENSCDASQSIVVERIEDVVINLDSKEDVLCFGEKTGSATVVGTLGQEPYNFDWSHGAEGDTQTDLEAGEYIVTVTDNLECTAEISLTISSPEAIVLTVDSVGPSYFGETEGFINISVEGGEGPYLYEWYDEFGILVFSGEDAQELAPGDYYVVILDANNCTISSDTITVEGVSGVNNIDESSLKLYPNPVSEILNVQYEHINLVGEIELKIENASGKLMQTISINKPYTAQINVKDYPQGTYFISVQNGEESIVHKFVKQ